MAEAIRGRHINQGALCQRLEEELARRLGAAHVVLTTSGSAALALSLMACGVGPGDEVILPALSYIATAHAVLVTGAKVRLVDVRADRPLIDETLIEPAVTGRTRAIVPVHLNGAACRMAPILAIARRHGLKVIEDAAQALGSCGPNGALGTCGDAGAFSMSIAKLITTGEGGFVAVNDDHLHHRMCLLRNQGVEVIANNVFDRFGFNLRFTDLLAAVGLAQLHDLDAKMAAVLRTYRFYRDELADLRYLRMMQVDVGSGELPLWSQAYCAQRQEVIELLETRGIQARPLNPPLYDSPHLHCRGDFPNARKFASGVVTLPSGPGQSQDNLRRTVEALREIGSRIDVGALALGDET